MHVPFSLDYTARQKINVGSQTWHLDTNYEPSFRTEHKSVYVNTNCPVKNYDTKWLIEATSSWEMELLMLSYGLPIQSSEINITLKLCTCLK